MIYWEGILWKKDEILVLTKNWNVFFSETYTWL